MSSPFLAHRAIRLVIGGLAMALVGSVRAQSRPVEADVALRLPRIGVIAPAEPVVPPPALDPLFGILRPMDGDESPAPGQPESKEGAQRQAPTGDAVCAPSSGKRRSYSGAPPWGELTSVHGAQVTGFVQDPDDPRGDVPVMVMIAGKTLATVARLDTRYDQGTQPRPSFAIDLDPLLDLLGLKLEDRPEFQVLARDMEPGRAPGPRGYVQVTSGTLAPPDACQ